MMKQDCTYCGEPFSIEEEEIGGFVQCPHCQQTNVLEQDAESDESNSNTDSRDDPSSESDPSPSPPEENISKPSSSKANAKNSESTSNAQKKQFSADESNQNTSKTNDQTRSDPKANLPRNDVSAWGIVSLIFGVLSLPASCLFCIMGFIPGAIAIVTGWVGISKTSKEENKSSGKGMAIGGLITGIIGTLLSLAWIGLFVLGAATSEPGDTSNEPTEIEVEIPEEEQNHQRNDDSDPKSDPSQDQNDQEKEK